MMRQLYRISRGSIITAAGERRNTIIDFCLGIGIPILQMVLGKFGFFLGANRGRPLRQCRVRLSIKQISDT